MKRLRAIALLLLVSTSAQAADRDPWFARDKALHFTVEAGVAGGGYALGAALFTTRPAALATGAGLGILVGVGKETLDLTGLGDPSWRDLAWDGLGVLAGLAIALTVDCLVRRSPARAALFTF